MTQAKLRFTSLEDYLEYVEGTDARYELVDGVLVDMGTETRLNEKIALWLLSQLLQFVPIGLIARGTQIAVQSRSVTVRDPDLIILTDELDQALSREKQSLIKLEMPAPAWILEVVSPGNPGTQNYDRDYIEKTREYAARGIPEYWLVDPNRAIVMVLFLEGNQYREIGRFQGNDRIQSRTFPNLQFTAAQVLSAGT